MSQQPPDYVVVDDGTEMLVYAKLFVLAEGATGPSFGVAGTSDECLAFFASAFRTMASASASLIGCFGATLKSAGLNGGIPDTPLIPEKLPENWASATALSVTLMTTR